MARFAELIHTPALLWTPLGAIISMDDVLKLPGSLAGLSVVGARLGTHCYKGACQGPFYEEGEAGGKEAEGATREKGREPQGAEESQGGQGAQRGKGSSD